MHQVNVKNWCCVLPTKPVTIPGSVDDPLCALKDLFLSRHLVDMLIVCSPEITILSSGRKRASIVTDMPIKTLDHSIASAYDVAFDLNYVMIFLVI
jgi:hypothetical protein